MAFVSKMDARTSEAVDIDELEVSKLLNFSHSHIRLVVMQNFSELLSGNLPTI